MPLRRLVEQFLHPLKLFHADDRLVGVLARALAPGNMTQVNPVAKDAENLLFGERGAAPISARTLGDLRWRADAVEVARGSAKHVLWMPSADAWVVRQVFERGEYSGIRPEWLSPEPVMVDVGAHCGTFALYAKLTIGSQAVIHCFEPYTPHVELLRRNVTSLPGVTVYPVGLGRADARVELLLDPGSGAGNSTVPALVPNPAGRVPVLLRDAAALWGELGFGEVDVLKLDAEGAEADILERLGDRVRRVRVILVEYHTPALRRRVDALLPDHELFGAVIHSTRVGTLKYVRADLVV